jgi:predicted metal-dependent enzyme (double-stranded beta helix superfamily)
METISLPSAQEESQLEVLAALPLDLALRKAVPFLVRLSDNPAFLNEHVVPLLQEPREEAKDWYVAYSCNGQDYSYSLQVFFWPPGSRSQIHDHTSWGAYYCVVGSVLEERYERLDDGSHPNHARLKKVWQLSWSRDDGPSTVLPYEGGIHRVGNPSDTLAISVHLYGPRIGEVDGRDYGLSQNYVCDRLEA